jgi:hypothetical protein
MTVSVMSRPTKPSTAPRESHCFVDWSEWPAVCCLNLPLVHLLLGLTKLTWHGKTSNWNLTVKIIWFQWQPNRLEKKSVALATIFSSSFVDALTSREPGERRYIRCGRGGVNSSRTLCHYVSWKWTIGVHFHSCFETCIKIWQPFHSFPRTGPRFQRKL